MQVIQVIDKKSKRLIARSNGTKDIILFDKKVLIKQKCLINLSPKAKRSLSLSMLFGINKEIHLVTDDNMKIPSQPRVCLIPMPWFPIAYGRIIIERSSIVLSIFDDSIDYSRRPLQIMENEILGKLTTEGPDESHKRIIYLIENRLIEIESRDERKSVLYKDKEDGRFWQLFKKNNIPIEQTEILLSSISASQWSYSYIEQRELKKSGGGNINPQEYLDSLQEDSNGRVCEAENCQNITVKYSSQCKYHHYESVMGRPYDKEYTKPV